ncbi:hypothetical protein HZA99_00075 [Candidatus Woesearchaeota archaeon]|nr:hypothetical protein [Candidatus Woesearchaeota archaeon]
MVTSAKSKFPLTMYPCTIFVSNLVNRSNAIGYCNLGNVVGRLVGVAPEAQKTRSASAKNLDRLVNVRLPLSALKGLEGETDSFVYKGRTYRLDK